MAISRFTLRRSGLLALKLACAAYFTICVLMWWNQEALVFMPPKLPDSYVFSFPERFTEKFVNASDGGRVSLVEFAPHDRCKGTDAPDKGTVLFFHGQAITVQIAADRVLDFTSRCWSAVFADIRPYGKSRGRVTSQSPLLDSEAAFDFVRATMPLRRVVIYGQSLGTGFAAALAAVRQPEALILEAPYTSVLRLASERYPYLPIWLLLQFPFNTDEALKVVKAPVYVLHGDDDAVIPHAHSHDLALEFPDKLQLITLPGGSHFNVIKYPQYARLLDKVLGSRVRPSSAQ